MTIAPASHRRHAIYWVPAADHPLWRAGCDWLGRDPETGAAAALDPPPGRAQPRRYGFHATLKPPFTLRDDVGEDTLLQAIAGLAAATAAFTMPPLHVAPLGDFIALRPVDDTAVDADHPLRRLADDCVRRLEPLRRPATAAETARHLVHCSSMGQRQNVFAWGYPHVFDSWRFHMTLSDGLPAGVADARRAAELEAAREHFAAALALPLSCDAVALFVEDAPGADLRLARRFGFAR